jgi:DNA polymerase-3 subunit gamma/tau
MSYQVLARKWRPSNFTELVGQEHVQRALVNALDNDRLHHAYLFTGTRGVGKTTIARIFAKSLNCEEGVGSNPCGKCSACEEIAEGRFVDLIEVDAASRTKVEDTRELLENVQYAPTRGRYKVYLIDEVHMLSGHSFNALLKTLEEPPPHVKFLLATTDPQRLPVTILSRCLQFNLKSLTLPQITGQLTSVLKSEGIKTDEGALRQLAYAADGSMRDALSLLDQAIAFCDGELTEDGLRSMLGTIDRDVVYRLLSALGAGDAATLMQEIGAADQFAPDYAALLADILSVLQRVAVAQMIPDALDDTAGDLDAVQALAEQLSHEDVQLFYQIGLVGRRDLSLAPEPRGGFEMVVLRMLAFRPETAGNSQGKPASRPKQAPATSARSAGKQRVAATPAAKTNPDNMPPASAVSTAEMRVDSVPPASASEWSSIIDGLSLKGMVREMALNCALQEIDGDRIALTIDSAHIHLLNKTRQSQLETALSEHFRRAMKVAITDEGKAGVESPARQQSRETEQRQQRAVQSIEDDENIKAIQDAFGGTVFEESIRPND